MISFDDIRLWILMQTIVSALCWRFVGFSGFIGSLIGAFLYIYFSK